MKIGNIIGIQIKDLIFSNSGVLICEKNVLKFIDPKELIESRLSFSTTCDKKIVFISNNFDLVNLLEPYKIYTIELNEKFLTFLSDEKKLDVVIRGVRG